MLNFLFRRLTADSERGAELFAAITRHAREAHWYVGGQVPDTLDGRFAMLATVTALVLARLEREGEAGNPVSVALTERFIEVMEAEHRELGLGDPTLGKTVRKLVGSLARRAGLWRVAIAGETGWDETVRESLYKNDVSDEALGHSAYASRKLWTALQRAELADIAQGRFE